MDVAVALYYTRLASPSSYLTLLHICVPTHSLREYDLQATELAF